MREREIMELWPREKAAWEGEKRFVGEQRSHLATICISTLPFFMFYCFVFVFLFLSSLFFPFLLFPFFLCYSTKAGKILEYFSNGQSAISLVRASDNETDRPSLIGPFRPIKSEFFREPRKRRGNGPESDFERS